jgi:microcystin-dependent protein
MASPFLGEIRLLGFTFAPRGWAFCNGQLLQIAQNSALFALLGTTYGGNGQTTFALPNLQGRVPVGTGTGAGLSTVVLGQVWGTETVALTTAEMPIHNHAIQASSGRATTNRPTGAFQAAGNSYSLTAGVAAGPSAIAGSGQAHPNVQPSLGMNFAIALQGIFPSRN